MATVKIENKEIFFTAVESIQVNQYELIVDTVGGKTYKKVFSSKEQASHAKKALIDAIILHAAL